MILLRYINNLVKKLFVVEIWSEICRRARLLDSKPLSLGAGNRLVYIYIYILYFIFGKIFTKIVLMFDDHLCFKNFSRSSGVKHRIPIWWTKSANLVGGNALVSKSASWYSVPTKYNSIVPFSTCSLMK
jgi:hypothetical protein